MARSIEIERLSPLAQVYRAGPHGNFEDGVGVALSEPRPGSIVQLAAWPGEERRMIDAIRTVTGLALPDGAGGGVSEGGKAAFGFAPGKFTVVDEKDGLAAAFAKAITPAIGTVTDLSHGRTVIRIEGPEAEWVLAKFFAIDFSLAAFPLGAGRSTTHHDVFAQIQRTGPDRFDVHVFRSFARSFWTALCHGSEEVGYEVA
ncbi:MAG: sarcosine oxidase subunit gamma family protein [Mesorhizobium sp.]|nr:sarcosine oxidase subunit gamma family protein [Mesorhizobium sp.]MBN9245465.1 sarcosine oxidase subunit gamma family protein [Mesorhizobium sp.]MBN9272091.1 sarcosine oxidase subunit gamma family protein [Mesorhizobium sp.]